MAHRNDESPTSNDAELLNHKRTILVADGNATIRKLVRMGLDPARYDIVESATAEEAWRTAKALPAVHALLVDALLEGSGNRLQFCRRSKSDPDLRTIPVVVLTSTGSNEEISEVVQAGADEFLSKPINLAELQLRIRSVTRASRGDAQSVDVATVAKSLARAVACKDGYSSGHVDHVVRLALAFGKHLGLETEQLSLLRYGALLHNVGKIAIPDEVLEKSGPLTPRERSLYQQHPKVGSEICAPLKPLAPVMPIIRHHKEHFDGSGYPDGLCGNEIPLAAQVLGIVDTYSALVHDRPFRRALCPESAMEILNANAARGIHDPSLVSQFCGFVREHESGAFEPVLEPVRMPHVFSSSQPV